MVSLKRGVIGAPFLLWFKKISLAIAALTLILLTVALYFAPSEPFTSTDKDTLTQKTIDDFGDQWNSLQDNSGYYTSSTIFQSIVGDHFNVQDLEGKTCIDIGSGTGRIVQMILNSKAAHVHAVEPATKAFEVLKKNTQRSADKITYHNETGDTFNISNADFALSFGVIHHIPNPKPTLSNIYRSLKPGGKFIMWVYGYEGNEFYLSIFQPLRAITTKMSDSSLHTLSKGLTYVLSGYIWLCQYIPLPMQDYMLGHLGKFSWQNRYYTVFDQLNPAWAKYYKKDEAIALMRDAGFNNITTHHYHSYSWALVGTK